MSPSVYIALYANKDGDRRVMAMILSVITKSVAFLVCTVRQEQNVTGRFYLHGSHCKRVNARLQPGVVQQRISFTCLMNLSNWFKSMKQIILEETFLTTHAFSLTILWGVGTYNDPSSVPSMVTLRLSVYSSLDTGLSGLSK